MNSTYEQDLYAWAMHNAKLLRTGQLAKADIENIAEELESMGASEKRELISRFTILLGHLLKWQFQPEKRGNSWRATIVIQRLDLKEHLADNPSLKHQLNERFRDAYRKGLLLAVKETGFHQSKFPKESPFTIAQVFDEEYFPE